MQNVMVKSAESALSNVLGLKKGERILIVSDQSKKLIGRAFVNAARKMGAVVTTYLLKEEERPFENLPHDLESLLKEIRFNVIVNLLTAHKLETPFRVKLLKTEGKTGARVGHGPGITEEMMVDGPLSADFKEVLNKARQLMTILKGAENIHITTELGTDLTLGVKGRGFVTDLVIEPEHFGNLPPGEIWCGPEENKANGVVVVDGSIGDLGQVEKNLTITIENGKVSKMECADENLLRSLKELMEVDEMASVIGELGIGLNPKAKITGILLEDEKADKTMHIAFGNNEDMPGGKNMSKTHRDFLFTKPSASVKYEDGTTREFMRKGELLL